MEFNREQNHLQTLSFQIQNYLNSKGNNAYKDSGSKSPNRLEVKDSGFSALLFIYLFIYFNRAHISHGHFLTLCPTLVFIFKLPGKDPVPMGFINSCILECLLSWFVCQCYAGGGDARTNQISLPPPPWGVQALMEDRCETKDPTA